MSIWNWLALPVAFWLWTVWRMIAHWYTMYEAEKGSAEDIYMERSYFVGGMIGYGALFTFITQLIPIPAVKNFGLVLLAISFVLLAILKSGVLEYDLNEKSKPKIGI